VKAGLALSLAFAYHLCLRPHSSRAIAQQPCIP